MSTFKALVIDDNSENVEVLSSMLTIHGGQVFGFKDPTKALAALATLPALNVVFVDLDMPKINGFEMLEHLRGGLPNVPILAYTVHISEIDVVRQMGFDGFLGKPLDHDRFPGLLQRILNGQPVWEMP
jgi:two-component system, cell cycle response regulator DivK